ncbi:MAG: DNA translocase FtsK, partial [Oscillospiraceae bacterium]|nr:DNA translocase FtsK [Oscillospiraceae bacterium]
MPAQKKKTTKTAAKAKTSTAKKAPTRRGKKQSARKPFRRELGGILCALLALCLIVGMTPTEAIFITHFTSLVRGLFGYGVWMAVPALLLAGYNLVFHHGRHVRLRTTATLLLPVLTGSLAHIILSDVQFEGMTGAVKLLWTSGIEGKSGGVISGAIGYGLEALFAWGAGVMLAAALFVFVLLALNLTLGEIVASFKNRERLEYEPEEEEEIPMPRHPVTASEPKKAKPRIDIPLEHEVPAETPAEEPLAASKRSGFFSHKSEKVKAPDELFTPQTEPTQEAQRAAEQTKADIEAKKISASEVAEATVEVAAEIATELEEPTAEYSYPPITLLEQGGGSSADFGAELRNNARRLADTLKSFGVEAAPGDVVRGPSVTRYEFMLDQGVKLSKVTNLSD